MSIFTLGESRVFLTSYEIWDKQMVDDHVIEEIGEFLAAQHQRKRSRATGADVIEELCDVSITAKQTLFGFAHFTTGGFEFVNGIYQRKWEKLLKSQERTKHGG
jgi:hypothetical protein